MVSSCRQIAPRLSAFAEGGLTGAAGRAVAEHILACRGCRGTHDRIASGVALARRMAQVPAAAGPPSWDDLAPLLDASVACAATRVPLGDRLAARVRAWGVGWRWTLAAAVGASLLVVAGALARGGRPEGAGAIAEQAAMRTWLGAQPGQAAVGPQGDPLSRLGQWHPQLAARRVGDLTVVTWTGRTGTVAVASPLPDHHACAICHDPSAARLPATL